MEKQTTYEEKGAKISRNEKIKTSNTKMTLDTAVLLVALIS